MDFPTPNEFFIEIPLYKTFNAERKNWQEVEKVVFPKEPIDAYCLECSKNSTQ